jgi:hypothetical protein
VYITGGLLAGGPACAQYAAPGFPMLPLHRPLPPPGPPPEDPANLPRFWHERDAERQAVGRNRFFELVMARAEYPAAAKPPATQPTVAMPVGRLLVVLQVRADGSVRQPPRISRRELEQPESTYPPAAIRALDQEAQRVLGSLHFVRSRATLDSLVVPMRFQTREADPVPRPQSSAH